MKFLLVCRIAFITALVVISPFVSIASDGGIDKPLRREIAESVLTLFQDSIPQKKKAPIPQPARKTPPQDVRIKDRAIKQVPRSVPKLKPQPVSDQVKVRGRQ